MASTCRRSTDAVAGYDRASRVEGFRTEKRMCLASHDALAVAEIL